jgi:hypothetical protein
MPIIIVLKIVGFEIAIVYIWLLVLSWDARQEYTPPKPKVNKNYKEYIFKQD